MVPGEKRDTSRQNGDISKVLELVSYCPFMDLEAWVGLFKLGLKFGGGGEVILTMVHAMGRVGVRIDFIDQGPGIPEDKLTAIFDRFYTERPAGV